MNRSSIAARKNAGFIFLYVPWWLNIVLAAFCYVGIVYGLPALANDRPIIATLALGLRPLAPYLGLFFLLFAAFGIIRDLLTLRKKSAVALNADSIYSVGWNQVLRVVSDGFRREGFSVEFADPDSGTDLHLTDQQGHKWIATCRYWQNDTIDVPWIRELFGVMTALGVHRGIFLATGGFTPAAVDFAGDKGIFLVGGTHFLKHIGLESAASTT